ncbi:competence protein F [Thalassotalea insulae]|uniref:Competence protein F n=1 Tax=Thalassotalea insulae TaxID=2056778 RepID=A0ABQ6GS22_9GAMM|nr:ComF family protein [Thalassotalea insulae]GLX78717.1 competence protein F [Thalassotalea insulae]
MELLYRQKLLGLASRCIKLEPFYQQLKLTTSCCELCQGTELIHPLLCLYCNEDLPRFQLSQCHYDLLNWPAVDKLFPKRNFDRLLALTPYLWPIDSLLKQLKYHNRFELADLLGFLLSQLWKKLPDNNLKIPILSVPVHLTKWQNRGYNQAHLIAKSFAQYTELNYLPDALIRDKSLPSQVGQSGMQRRKNINQAFSLTDNKQKFPPQLILLDDVITTGTTVNAICKLLKNRGVEKVTVLTVAFTLPSKK